MVNYAITNWTSSVGVLADIGDEIETYLETIDNSKTIYSIDLVTVSSDNVQAMIIHDA